MKLIQVNCQFQHTDDVIELLTRLKVHRYTAAPQIKGCDEQGPHLGSQAFPGHMTRFDLSVPEEQVERILRALEEFRRENEAQSRVWVLVLTVERYLPEEIGESFRSDHETREAQQKSPE